MIEIVQTAEIIEKNGLSFQDFWRYTYIMNVYCYMFKVAIVKLMSGTELSNAVKNALLI